MYNPVVVDLTTCISGYRWNDRPSVYCVCVRHVCVRFLCVCVLHALILLFRGAPLPVPTCVNTAVDHMADNDFQIDTLHSSGGENQWALIAFFPRRSSLPEGHYLSLSASVSLPLTHKHWIPFILLSMRLHQTVLLFTGDLAADGQPPSV